MKTPQSTRKITTQVLAVVAACCLMAVFILLPDHVHAKKNRGQNSSNGHAQVSTNGGHGGTDDEGGTGAGKSGKKGKSQSSASSSLNSEETSVASSSSDHDSGKGGKGHASSGKGEKGHKGSGSSGKDSGSGNATSSSSTSASKGSGGHDGNVSSGRRQGGKGKAGSGGSSGHTDVVTSTSEDEDSDKPEWAGKDGNHDLKPGGGNSGSDRKKGTDYGDLFVMSRADDGTLLMYDILGGTCDEGEKCYSAAIIVVDGVEELFVLAPDVDPPDTVQEVELGRLNISRAPDKVLAHAFDEALSKLDGITITADNLEEFTDLSGRLLTTDGITAIDSPLENLSLYQAILEAYVDELTDITLHSGSSSLTLEAEVIPQVAASALAAASDKHGTIQIDEVAYLSKFLDVEESLNRLVEDYDDWYNPEDFYDVNLNVLDVSGTSPVWDTVNLLDDDLDLFNEVPDINDDANGIDVFSQAVDDSVQVLEFAHDNVTQVISN